MTMSMEEISDRLEIQDLMVRYSYAIDSRDWDALDDVFTPDAHIDYSVFGGSVGDLASTKEFLASAMPMFAALQHMVSGTTIAIDGDTADDEDAVPQPDDDGRRRRARPDGRAGCGTSTSSCAPPTAGGSRSGSRRRSTCACSRASRRDHGLERPPYVPAHGLLAGKTVLVTAAAGTGIGSSVAQRCLEEGARVLISDKHERRSGRDRRAVWGSPAFRAT